MQPVNQLHRVHTHQLEHWLNQDFLQIPQFVTQTPMRVTKLNTGYSIRVTYFKDGILSLLPHSHIISARIRLN